MTNEVPDFGTLYDLTEKNPDRTLNLAIILQALLDMSKPRENNESSETSLQRDQASAWVFASIGVTCENFKNTCHLAGLEPDIVRDFALKTVTSENVNDIRRKLNSFL
jgi:hypothetical protein|tara:strand:- start:352 stop:675 length:324 start_codon:yes stop_codon:yes gene_type:complete